MTAAVAACMRNEGPYLLEWLAYHRAIGFDRLLVATNDCTDGSDLLLDRLADHGIVTHLPGTVPPGTAPQSVGMANVFTHLRGSDIDWLLHVDADEFLNIGLGAGMVADLLAIAGEGDVIPLPWLLFGDNGERGRPLPVLPHFTACEGRPDPKKVKFKTMFRHAKFGGADDHLPRDPLVADLKVHAADGSRLHSGILKGDTTRRKFRPIDRSIRPEAAVINHYAVRGEEDFLMRNDRGDGQGKPGRKYHLGSYWHRAANRNDTDDRRILRHWPATQALMAAWRALPGVAAAEAACLDWDETRRRSLLTPEKRQRWTRTRKDPAGSGDPPA